MIGCLVLEELKIRRRAESHQGDLRDGSWMHVEMALHPVVVMGQGRQAIYEFAAEWAHGEADGDIKVGHRKRHMIHPARARHP